MKPWLASLLCALASACANDFPARCADRAAIERVYHMHRTGSKPPFEQAMPYALLEKLVRADVKKEAVLAQTYGMKITDETVAAEVVRIDATTRAPEMLAEIKAALGGDPARIARSLARPIVVERTLRARFENDDQLHAPLRREAELAGASLRAGQPVEGMNEVTWQLTPRPAGGETSNTQHPTSNIQPSQSTASSASYSIDATAQVAQPLTPPAPERDRKLYFDDLDPELQKVLRVQMQKPGDVSAVVETPGGFLLFQAKDRNAETLHAATLSIPKRSFEEWLAQQPEATP